MLTRLTIRDFVLFDDLDLDLTEGLNVISGETGGGKSNLTSALALLAGGRARRDQVRKGRDFASIGGTFVCRGRPLEVTRIVGAGGQGRCVIDSEAVPASRLREQVGAIVSISGQHEQISLTDSEAHRRILDEFAGLAERIEEYRQCHGRCRELGAELARLRQADRDREYRQEWLEHQIREIRAASPAPGEDVSLEADIRMLANAERISRALAEAADLLYEGDGSAAERSAAASRRLQDIASWLPDAQEWVSSIEDARALIEDTGRSLATRMDSVDMDPTALEAKQERAYLLQTLKKKHGGSIEAMLESLDAMQAELDTLADISGAIRRTRASLDVEASRALELAAALTRARQRASGRLGKRIESELASLAFEAVDFVVRVTARSTAKADPLDVLDENGCDDVLFLFRPNVGEDLMPLQSIASGGELSRVFLAIRATLGAADSDRVLVFDEADTGIGGKVADALGSKLHAISRGQQVICITHLAQIAAYADTHILVVKQSEGERTTSRAVVLDEKGRTDEIARMLGGERVTRKAKEAATEMLSMARAKKG